MLDVPYLMWGWGGAERLYSDVQCIMGNGYMGTPDYPSLVSRQKLMKTLPFHNFAGEF